MKSSQPNPKWLEKAVFYEIYPQSYSDSNGDGIGDIPGILQKLDYLQSLGINAIWINPCFDSPFADAGYDVKDYYKVAPRYGTNDDMRQLFDEAARRNIHILLDLVPGHTSIEHPWFTASCKHERNKYSDYYIWTDSAWTWEARDLKIVAGFAERDGNYITNFFYSQPALNYGFANPVLPWQQPVDAPGPMAVRQEIKNIIKFWLDMGASGFRVDMAGSLVKFDTHQKETCLFWQEIRTWMDQEYPEAMLVAEWSQPKISIPAGFHADFLLHFGSAGWVSLFRKPNVGGPGSDPYGWSFFDRSGHGNIKQFLDEYLDHYQKTKDQGLIAIPTGNHDVNPRISIGRTADDLEIVYAFLMTMPGLPFIYYGDEIGMRSIQGLPSREGAYNRTASRTPMQWDSTPNAGFSTAQPDQLYLPVDPDSDRPSVASQENDPHSLLNRVRRLIALRQAHPALGATGDFNVVFAEAGQCPFVYTRSKDGECILVAVNPSRDSVEIQLPPSLSGQQYKTLYGPSTGLSYQANAWKLHLPGISYGIYQLI